MASPVPASAPAPVDSGRTSIFQEYKTGYLRSRGARRAEGRGKVSQFIRNPLTTFFKFLGWVVMFTVGLFLVYVIGFTIYSLAFTNVEFTSGFLGGYGVEVYTWLQQKNPGFAEKLAAAYAVIKNPEAEYSRQQLQGDAPVKKVKERREIFVKEFGAKPDVFRSGKPIRLKIDVVGKNPAQDTRISGSCGFEVAADKSNLGLRSNREMKVADIVFDGDTGMLEKDISEQHAYGSCSFPEGALYQANDFVKKITAKVHYRASSVAFWKFYYIHSDYQRDNPRGLIRDADMKSDGSMKTSPEYEAAMSIGFIAEAQPYDEERQRELSLLFFRNTGVDGSLGKLHSLKIIAPANFVFVDDEDCDFEQGGGDENGVEYLVKQDALKEIDVDCSSQEIAKGILGKENCERIYKNDLAFSCGFHVEDVNPDVQSPQYGVLKAVADYDFVAYGRTTVQVLESPVAEGSL